VAYAPRGLSYKAFNLPSHPDHKYIPHLLPEVNFLMVEISTPKPYIFMIRVTRQMKCLNDPRGLSYKVFNLPSHPDHKYIWLRGGDLDH
jgi:hypothetical protein